MLKGCPRDEVGMLGVMEVDAVGATGVLDEDGYGTYDGSGDANSDLGGKISGICNEGENGL